MTCPTCGAANAAGARFCGTCGGRLTAICPHCLADVTPGLRFCNACGGPMPRPPDSDGVDGPAPGTADDAASERRLVSVLFLDLVDFTALAETLDPEDVRSLQSRYFEAARSVIAHYGGTLEKFIGDAVMAVWGAPAAHEDDAERSVRAALELVATVAKVRGAEPDRRLTARAAVSTGEAAVVLGAEGQGIVAGDLVNTAARLQHAAPSGAVLVDDTTRRIVGDVVAFEPGGELLLKGKSGAVVTWRAVGVADVLARGGRSGHSGPFVGRDRELEELLELHRRTIQAGRSRLVSVLGIAGIGKSRLIWEFLRRLEASLQPVALHVGRAPSYGEGITFAPLAEMVRRRAGITEGTEVELARRQLADALVELVPDALEREWIEPRLATLVDPGAHAAYEREELFAAWRRFFERVAAWAPALLVFEDVQWADPTLLDFIDHLATWSRSHPILIVTLARPELLDRRPTWGAGQPSFTAVQLEPLQRGAMTELLLGLAPSLPADTVQVIVERSGGVPLYGVEVVRMLVDRGYARAQDGRVELLEPIDHIQVPETLHSLVSARIDALPPSTRSMVLAASVLGRRFHPDALAAISGLGAAEARARIAALVRRELVTVDDELRSPGRGQLAFIQDVVRDVAYRTLSRRERRTLHVSAADHLESLRDDELVEAVAEHLVEAHRAVPDHRDAPGVAARAVDSLRRAAARALALHVPGRALTHLQRALELTDDDDLKATLWEEAAVAARAAPRFELAETFLRRLIDWRVSNGTRGELARARARLASLLLATERHDTAIGDLELALEGIGDGETDAAVVELTGQLARARVLVGNDDAALRWADRTIDAARSLGLDAVAVDALITRGTAHMHLGDDDAGLADLHAAIAESELSGFIGAELRGRNNLAWLVVADDPLAALDTARGGLALATRMGVGDMALQLAEVVSVISLDTGDWEAAAAIIEDVRARPQATAHRIAFAGTEATLRALRGETPAGAPLDELEPIAAGTDPQLLATSDLARAWIAFVDGRFVDARRHADAAGIASLGADRHRAFVLAARASLWLADAEQVRAGIDRLAGLAMHGRSVEAAELTVRAGSAALAGEPRALAMYRQATETWRSLGLPLQLALCLLERDRLRARAGDEDLEPASNEAVEILERLGAAGASGLARRSAGTERAQMLSE